MPNRVLPFRGKIALTRDWHRWPATVRDLERFVNTMQDDLDSLKLIVKQLSGGEADTSIAPHSTQHQSGGGDEVYFATLERSASDSTNHDAYRDGPHIKAAERTLLEGGADLIFQAGFGPALPVFDGSTWRYFRLTLGWNADFSLPQIAAWVEVVP